MAQGLMWVFVIAYGLLGVVAAFFPNAERGLVRGFTRTKPVRFLGLVLIVSGVLVFRAARETGWPMLAQSLGVIHTIAGGVNLILPDAMVVFNEAWVERKGIWHRLLGLLYLAVAYLCYLATIVPTVAPPSDVV